MQTGCNRAGGFIVENRGKNIAWKEIRPKSRCYAPVFVWLIEAKPHIQGFCNRVKGLVSKAHWASVMRIFVCFTESKQQISRHKEAILWHSSAGCFGCLGGKSCDGANQRRWPCLQNGHSHSPSTSEVTGSCCSRPAP